jgi:hypothetical protein
MDQKDREVPKSEEPKESEEVVDMDAESKSDETLDESEIDDDDDEDDRLDVVE